MKKHILVKDMFLTEDEFATMRLSQKDSPWSEITGTFR